MRSRSDTADTPTADNQPGRVPLQGGRPTQAERSVLDEPPISSVAATRTTMDAEAGRAALRGCVVLLEHPKPWADDPLETHTLPPAVRTRLRALEELGVRVALVQRPSGAQGTSLFCSVPDHGGLILQRRLEDAAEVADLDLAAVLRGAGQSHTIADGFTEAEPQFLVTAHASPEQRHRGADVAAAMVRRDPDNVWESSELLGQAVDVSVVVLPKGLISTQVDLADAGALVDAGWQDRVLLWRYAGHLQDAPAIRLAESSLRRRLGADDDTAVAPIDSTETPIEHGDEDGSVITRHVTTWRVAPSLVDDLTPGGRRPDPSGAPQQAWRVVVDRTTTGDPRAERLTVVEVGEIAEPGGGTHEWDAHHAAAEPPLTPNPTVVSEVSALTPGRALDLGCGTGRHALWLAENGWQVTGVDFSRTGLRRMTSRARRREVHVNAELADLRIWTPGDATFDLILVSDVQLDDVFRRTSPWLSPTGRIIVIGPAAGSESGQNASPIDYVHLAARATGVRLRVLRAGEVACSDDARRDALVIAAWPA